MEEACQHIDYIYLPQNTFLGNDEYRIINKLTDRSNFSIVYLALNKEGRRVAIKEFFPRNLVLRDLDGIRVVCKSSNLKQRLNNAKELFLSEALILKEFKNNHSICYLYEYFQENNSIYIVMDYYEGKTLEDVLREKNEPIEVFFKKYYFPLIEAVKVIHKKKYIHRDLKPNNIIIHKDRPVLIDFGSAINYKEIAKKKILLTPGFSPIEFYSEKTEQGPYSDIYSLAAILYYYFTNEIPVEANERIIEDQMVPISEYISDNGLELLGDIISNNLSLDYRRRCQSINSFKYVLLKQYYRYLLKNNGYFNK